MRLSNRSRSSGFTKTNNANEPVHLIPSLLASGISPAEQARMPEASRDRSSGTFDKGIYSSLTPITV